MTLRLPRERVLLIGDDNRQLHTALTQAIPVAQITHAPNYFDGIAELANGSFTAVLGAAEPIERRPEAAVQTLRQLAGESRVLLFGHPTLEPLSRKMMDFGADDYIVTPPSVEELQQLFGRPLMRMSETPQEPAPEPAVTEPAPAVSALTSLPLAEILLDAMLQTPQDAPAAAIRTLNARIAPILKLHYVARGAALPAPQEGMILLTHAVRVNNEDLASLHLSMPEEDDQNFARHFLAQLAHLMGKAASLQDRHNRLQKLAITDDLTGVYNGRYFRHFLSRIIDKAKLMRFPVTLALFDIDNFKSYNDQYGHGVGDDILKQTAALMRRCVRDHDLVARISGDEFAVVFWEKEGPRQPRDGKTPAAPSRTPQTPLQVFERFRRLLASEDFKGLGSAGQGMLTISAGLAIYPYDASDVNGLIQAADNELMFRAKQSGKNSIFLVGNDEAAPESDEPSRPS
jgi:GGDEF domain-containing protein